MAALTPNQAAEALLPDQLLHEETRQALMTSPTASLLLSPLGGQVVWSSHAAARLLGFVDGAALMRAGLPAQAPGTRRLQQILNDGHAEGRLERLRFTISFRSMIITALCTAVPLTDGRLALAVTLPEAEASGNSAEHPVPVSSAIQPVDIQPTPVGLEPNIPAALPSNTTPAWLDKAAADRPMVRFVFGLDRDGLVERVTPPLAETVGADQADIVGQSLAGFVQRFDPVAADAIRSAILAGATWPAIRTLWPVSGQAWQVPVTLTALPLVVADEGLTGFSGFGRCELREAIAVAPLPVIPVEAVDPASPTLDIEPVVDEEVTSEAASETGAANELNLVETEIPNRAAWGDDVPEREIEEDEISEQSTPEDPAPEDSALEDSAPESSVPEGEALEGLAISDPLLVGSGEEPVDPVPSADPSDSHGRNVDPDTADLIAALEAFGASEPAPASEATATDPAVETADGARLPPSVPSNPDNAAAPFNPRALAAELDNVVSLRQGPMVAPPGGRQGLSMSERNAFREIAKALGAKLDVDFDQPLRALPELDKGPTLPALPGSTAPSNLADQPGSTGRSDQFDVLDPPDLPGQPARAAVLSGETTLLDRLPIGLLVTRDEETLFVNRTLLELTDYPDAASFRAEGGAQAIFRKGSLPRDRDSGFDTVVLTSRSGEMMPVDAHLQRINWEGAPASLVSLRRATELEQGKALRSVALDLKRVRSEAAELRAVLDTATDGVITLDDRGLILTLNGAAEALFGLSQNEVSGESFSVLLHNDSHADALDYFEGLRSNGVRSVLNDGRDVQGREKKGGRIPLFMTLGRISDEEPRRFCAVLRDLTAWKRAEAELTEARRAAELASAKKSDFLTKISHEIRTPMNAIIGFAEVMMEERLGPVGNAKYKEYLGDIRTSGQHVVSLVNDLLDLAKIEAGRMEMRFGATDLNTIVSSSVGMIQPQANAHRVLVRTQLAPRLPAVVADERSIRQIILNMLSNATRFTESGGQVIVATALLDTGEAVIRIRDTGIGMTSTEIEQALEPFRQVGTRRDHGGTGLGLPLTKALVEANRANFAIRSTPGEGTMVEITFPSTRVLAE